VQHHCAINVDKNDREQIEAIMLLKGFSFLRFFLFFIFKDIQIDPIFLVPCFNGKFIVIAIDFFFKSVAIHKYFF